MGDVLDFLNKNAGAFSVIFRSTQTKSLLRQGKRESHIPDCSCQSGLLKATTKIREAAQLNGKLKELKKTTPKNAELIAETETLITELTREARNNAAKAKEIEDAVYDLKAVNPNRKAEVDNRTPEEPLQVIEAKVVEIAEALSLLKLMNE